MTTAPHDSVFREAATVHLRLLATSDLHAHLRGYDYVTGRDSPATGLIRLATEIRRARAEVGNSLLFDNGDTIQGTALGDWAISPEGRDTPHPMIAAFNSLGLDAANIGNHEFNFGLEALRHSYAAADFPVLCANAVTQMADTPAQDRTLFPAWTLLERTVTDTTGQAHALKIAVLGVLPPQILNWDHRHLKGTIAVRGIVEAAQGHLPAMRAAGADLVIALCHSGIGADTDDPWLEQAAVALARQDGIDVVISGHAHGRFPGPDYAAEGPVDPTGGKVHGKPMVMPGSWGAHLGQIDLQLRLSDSGWQVEDSRSSLRPAPGTALPEDPALVAQSEPTHRAVLNFVNRPVGHTPQRLHNFLAMLGHDPVQQVVAAAQVVAMEQQVKGTEFDGIPILSATSPFKLGGRAGPQYYTDVPAGPMSIRHINDIYTYPNTLVGVVVNGHQLRAWIDRAAGAFNVIRPGEGAQALVNRAVPGYEFDTLFGVQVQFDLSANNRFDPATGLEIAPAATRIASVTFEGREVRATDRFLVATNNYRANGGGNYPGLGAGCASVETTRAVSEVVVEFMAQGTPRAVSAPPWGFVAVRGASLVLETSPNVRSDKDLVTTHALQDRGDSPDGFALFEAQF